jgi:hypothetical protein
MAVMVSLYVRVLLFFVGLFLQQIGYLNLTNQPLK